MDTWKPFNFIGIMFIFIVLLIGCDNENKTDDESGENKTILTIKNESSYEIIDAIWNDISFSDNQFGNSIKPGKSLTMTVQAGSGYIRFKYQINYSISARTKELLVVEKNEQKEFIFLDTTIVFNVNNTNSSGTLAYIAPQIGPGGGFVFFAGDGQYKECSGELNPVAGFNWMDAVSKSFEYRGGNFYDWYLPDKLELDLIYTNLHRKGIGGFFPDTYWSSTIDSYASVKDFRTGSWVSSGYNSLLSLHRVRAVRVFTR